MNNPDLSNQIHLTAATAFKSMSDNSLQQAREVEATIGSLPQIAIATDHVLHAGVYTRTVFLPKGSVIAAVSYTHLRAHETRSNLVCRLLLEKNFFNDTATTEIYTSLFVGSVRCV